jgi:hypothetical protein
MIMAIDARLQRLIAVVAPYWAGEGEVVRTYWTSPKRTRETDLLWLRRQSFKEFWGSGVGKYDRGGVFLGVAKSVVANADKIDVTIDRHEMLDIVEGLKAEFMHYCAFADVHDEIRLAGTPRLNPQGLKSWPEDDVLTALRYRHQEQHGDIGMRACKLTEGGYCGLFREGMAMRGKPGIDGKIAEACAVVHDDEFVHMMGGIANILNEDLDNANWKLLGELVTAQMQLRIHMRNAQFSLPLSEARIAAIFRGEIEPIAFDYKRAGLAA